MFYVRLFNNVKKILINFIVFYMEYIKHIQFYSITIFFQEYNKTNIKRVFVEKLISILQK